MHAKIGKRLVFTDGRAVTVPLPALPAGVLEVREEEGELYAFRNDRWERAPELRAWCDQVKASAASVVATQEAAKLARVAK